MTTHYLELRKTHFLLWMPKHADPAPKLVIGKFRYGNPPEFIESEEFELEQMKNCKDLWGIEASNCRLINNQVYHYWFKILTENAGVMLVSDPTAFTVDWRLMSPFTGIIPPDAGNQGDSGDLEYYRENRDPASVILFRDGELISCDPGGETIDAGKDIDPESLPPNNKLVIYELPTAWSRKGFNDRGLELGVGTFQDARKLLETDSSEGNFRDIRFPWGGEPHLKKLGINALELLPPADSFVDREWGYATSNYFSPDYDLGFPKGNSWPIALTGFFDLVVACHKQGIRVIYDAVMAFSTKGPYRDINFDDFHREENKNSPDPDVGGRKNFGGDLFRFIHSKHSYDPVEGSETHLVPARRHLINHIAHWILNLHIDGIRMDSVTNIKSYDFIGEFARYARQFWEERWNKTSKEKIEESSSRFLVMGESIPMWMNLIHQKRIEGLWNENFMHIIRAVILGKNWDNEPNFEWSVRKLIDCRLLGFTDCSQAVNYITSHDVEGYQKERFYNYLENNSIFEKDKKFKLAFACLLTAIGIPMILAGDEFADQHDRVTKHPDKQVDPVNYDRLADPWRQDICKYVSRLVKLRTQNEALASNEVRFIHTDFSQGKRVVVWQRGPYKKDLVVVVANFSDWGTPDPHNPDAEYVVNNWPHYNQLGENRNWYEAATNRYVPHEWIGREPIYPWEAKVYVLR